MSFDFAKYLEPWAKQELIANVDEKDYHATAALSGGQLATIMQTHVAHFKAEKDGLIKKNESDALRFGKLFHKAALEGPEFLKRYKVQPDFGDMRSSTNRAKRDTWRLGLPSGSIIIEDQEELDQITGMLNSVMNHRYARNLISGGTRELTGLFNWEGFRCRMRMDIFHADVMVIADVKTAKDATTEGFLNGLDERWGQIQAAFYRKGVQSILGKQAQHFSYIAVEKEPPYYCNVFDASEGMFTTGEMGMAAAAHRLRTAITTGNWRPEPEEVISLGISRRMEYKLKEMGLDYTG